VAILNFLRASTDRAVSSKAPPASDPRTDCADAGIIGNRMAAAAKIILEVAFLRDIIDLRENVVKCFASFSISALLRRRGKR
jgi:hypothetical protein